MNNEQCRSLNVVKIKLLLLTTDYLLNTNLSFSGYHNTTYNASQQQNTDDLEW